MLLLTLTAQEGRLGVDRHASLNTDQVSSTTVQRRYLCALALETGTSFSVKTGGNAAVLNRR
jgi:hypothetical protein